MFQKIEAIKKFVFYFKILSLSLLFCSKSWAADLPFLSSGKAINVAGFTTTQASFSGGMLTADGKVLTSATINSDDTVTVQTAIQVDTADIGKQADLLVVIAREPDLPYNGDVDTIYHVVSNQGQSEFVDLYATTDIWMPALAKNPYTANVTLKDEVPINFKLSQANAPAMFYVFIGYRLYDNNTISYAARPILLQAEGITTSNLPFVVEPIIKPIDEIAEPSTVTPPTFVNDWTASFVDQNAAIIGQTVTSNSLVMPSTETATVVGDGQLMLNGIVVGQSATVNPNDIIALTTTATSGDKELSVTIGSRTLKWKVQGVAPAQEIPALPGKMAGYTPVNCEVSESGGAVCQLPLTAPAGTSGMAPKLSLGYNSQGNNGPLGVGWSLNGLSAITRCRATQAQDGLIDAVDFDAHDRFCLDGEKLMAVEGEYGAEGTIYYTEQHTFQKIVSFLNPETQMPRFKAWTKTGLILEYGFTPDSSVEAQGRKDVMIWAVNKILDTKGNYLAVSYEENNDNGEYYPKRIDYTGNEAAGLSPFASGQFFYEDRPDVLPAFIGGSISAVTKRLSRVETWDDEEIYRKYSLAYEQAGAIQSF